MHGACAASHAWLGRMAVHAVPTGKLSLFLSSCIAFWRYLLSLVLISTIRCPDRRFVSSVERDIVLELYPYRLFFVVCVSPRVPLLAPFRRAQPVLLRGQPTSPFIRPVLIDGRADAERYPCSLRWTLTEYDRGTFPAPYSAGSVWLV